MAADDKINIMIRLADVKPIALSISREDEPQYRETEKLVKNLGKTPKPKKVVETNPSLDAIYANLSERCKQAIGTKVDITSKGSGSGKIEIEFYNSDDLEKIINRLCTE